MGWLQQSYKQSQFGRYEGDEDGHVFAGRDIPLGRRARKYSCLGLAVIVASVFLNPFEVLAAGPSAAAQAIAHTPKSRGALRLMNEDELRHVSGKGLPEDRLFRTDRYAAGGFGVEVLGDAAMLLNPVLSLVDADVTFKNVIYNPLNPTVIIDRTGTFMSRVPETVGTLSVDNIRVRGSNGKSFGSVTIRDIDLRGTAIRVTTRR